MQYLTDLEQNIIHLIDQERTNYREEHAFITEKIAFKMREVIKKCRKYYYGIFDDPKEPATGTDKIFVPLTEWTCETVIKNCDLDTKDINIRAKNPSKKGYAVLARYLLRNFMEKVHFGQLLDDMIRRMVIDGTVVVKVIEDKANKKINTYIVDLLNFFIDPTAESIEKATVLERSVMTLDEIESYEYWENTDDLKGSKSLSSIDNGQKEKRGEVPMRDVWERWGKMPKYFLTGNEEDKDIWVDGVIIVSGLEAGDPRIHYIEETDGKKPYEECWLTRVPNRWFGRGVAEKLFNLQVYVNHVVNLRRNLGLITQNGTFVIRQGCGIRQQDLSKLAQGGALVVQNPATDIVQLPFRNFAYNESIADENNIYRLAEKVTGAGELAQGQPLPASTSATAAMIQNVNSKSTFQLIQEGLGMFLERLFVNHYLPMVLSQIDEGDIVSLVDSPRIFDEIDNRLIEYYTKEKIKDFFIMNQQFPTPQQISSLKSELKEKLRANGQERFIKMTEKLTPEDLGVEVYVTNEKFDKATLLQNLQTLLVNLSRISTNIDTDLVLYEILDVLGMDYVRYAKKEEPAIVPQLAPLAMPNLPSANVLQPSALTTNMGGE